MKSLPFLREVFMVFVKVLKKGADEYWETRRGTAKPESRIYRHNLSYRKWEAE